MTPPLLQVRDLRVILASAPCCNRSRWTCNPAASLVLMGANGSGKSTLGMALAGHPHYRVTAARRMLAGRTCSSCATSARAPGCSCRSRRRPRSPA
jgi:Fe-S cluster assembly ATP-binding protein